MIKLVLSTILTLAACGCTMATYPGPRLPKEQVAYIDHRYTFGVTICVERIDGLENKGTKFHFASSFEILPGPHEIRIWVSERTLFIPIPIFFFPFFPPVQSFDIYGPVDITFRVDAGRTYSVDMGKLDTGAWDVWIEDGDSHTVVGRGKSDLKASRTSPNPGMREECWH